MNSPTSTLPFWGHSPLPSATATSPKLATHLNEQVYIEARDLLKDCLEKSQFGKFSTLLKYLPRLSLAQLEAIDKVRCNLFRGQKVCLKARIKDLKEYTEELNQIPWYIKYRLSGALVCGGAAIKALTFLYQGHSFVAIARVISMVPLCAGALLGAIIKVRDIYFGVLYNFNKLKLSKIRGVNKDLNVCIGIYQRKILGTTHIQIHKNQSPGQSAAEENSDIVGPSNFAVNSGPAEMAGEVGADQTGRSEQSSSEQPSSSKSALVSIPSSSQSHQDEARDLANATERALIAERKRELAESKLEQVLAQLRLLGTDVRIHEEETT